METLRAWVQEGRLDKDSLIYDHARSKWIEANKLPQILDCLQAPSNRTTPPPVASEHKDPNAQTTVSDPLTRAEVQVAAQIQIQRKGNAPNPQTRDRAEFQKMTISPLPMKTSPTSDHGNLKTPTILNRIMRIFLKPFAKQSGKGK